MKTLQIPDETFQFLLWLVKQDVTLPHIIVDYLQWEGYTKQEIKEHLHSLIESCYQARQ